MDGVRLGSAGVDDTVCEFSFPPERTAYVRICFQVCLVFVLFPSVPFGLGDFQLLPP